MIAWKVITLGTLLLSGGLQAKEYSPTMQFTEFTPCLGTGSMCLPQYLASGTLDDGAPARLQALLLEDAEHPHTVAFDSPGGSLAAGLALGELIRNNGLNTLVEGEYAQEIFPEGDSGGTWNVLATDAGCFSSCAYAFMGGVSRTIGEGGQIGVHRFYGGEGASTEGDTQGVVALISQYMARMGVNRDILDIASFTKSDDVLVVPLNVARLYNLDNQQPPLSKWELVALDSGDISLVVDQQSAGGDRHTRLGLIKAEAPDWLYLIVFQDHLSTSTDSEMGQFINGDVRAGSLCSGAKCMELEPVSAWSFSAAKETLMATYRLPLKAFVSLATGTEPLRYDAWFPSRFYKESPSVDLGRQGLRNGLLALLK